MRIETGVIKFDDDWPGVFIRGDDAFAFAMALEGLVKEMTGSDSFGFETRIIDGLLQLLKQSDMQHKNHKVNQIIETKSVMKVK